MSGHHSLSTFYKTVFLGMSSRHKSKRGMTKSRKRTSSRIFNGNDPSKATQARGWEAANLSD